MITKQKVCCIVDPFVSSEVIYTALLEKDILPIAILTDKLKLSVAEQSSRFNKDKFYKILNFVTGQDINILAEELSDYHIMAVIAGNERTCDIADQIAAVLSPDYANPVRTSVIRMDKYAMQDGLNRAGFIGIKQLRITSSKLSAQQTNTLLHLGFPIILKPTNQSGGFGVMRCESIEQLQTATKQLLAKRSHYGNTVDACVAQECLKGDEYFVDTVSYNGQAKIVGVYQYHKTIYQQKSIYRYLDTVDPESPPAKICIDYTKKILPALDLNYGMAHTELFLTTNGPRLVELNPRISGGHGFIAHLAVATAGYNQAQLFAASLVDKAAFLATINEKIQLKHHGKIVFLQCWRSKKLKKFYEDKIEKLCTYKTHKLIKKIGHIIRPPEDLHDMVAIVLLAHSDEKKINQDYKELLFLEENDLIFK